MKLSQFLSVFLLSCFLFPAFATADQLEDAKAAVDNKDYKKAYELLSPLAEAKDAEAQTRLGVMYVNGQGVEMDLTKGLGLIMEAANQGYDMAQGIALKIYMDIASTGDTGAMYNVGGMCLKGWGGEQDKTVCLKWLEQAARLGHERSGKVLNKIYAKGMYGITPDEEEANYWNDLLAAFAVGLDGRWEGSYSMGEGFPPTVMAYDFKTDGDKLTGTMDGMFGGPKIEIKKGKIDGNTFSFTVKSKFMGSETISDYNGEFYGDTIKLTYTTETKKGRTNVGASLLNVKETSGGEFPPITFIAKRSES